MRTDLTSAELLKSDYFTVYGAYEDYLYLINSSEYTRKAYLSNFRRYYLWCEAEQITDIYNQMKVKAYLIYRVKQGAKWQTMNNIYSAMRKLFREVLNTDWSFKKLPRAKKERHLPEILSKQDIQKLIIGCTKNIKHQTMIITLYCTGMRVGEMRKIKIKDILSDRHQIRIIKGKGSKDRYIDIPEILIEVLRKYYKAKRPIDYLFYGKYKTQMISVSAVRWAIKESKKRMKIHKKASTHTLRHCYATHHLESGTDLVYLQQNLGHKHLKTTARYIHLCKERYQHINHPIKQMKLPMLKGIKIQSEKSSEVMAKDT